MGEDGITFSRGEIGVEIDVNRRIGVSRCDRIGSFARLAFSRVGFHPSRHPTARAQRQPCEGTQPLYQAKIASGDTRLAACLERHGSVNVNTVSPAIVVTYCLPRT